MKYVTEQELCEKLKAEVDKYKRKYLAAAAIRTHAGLLQRVIDGKAKMPKKIADYLGYVPARVYVKKEQ